MKRTVESATFLDPLAHTYITDPNVTCSYKDGTFCLPEGKSYVGGCVPVHISANAAEVGPAFAEGSFDTIIMINTLEHVKDAIRIMENIYRWLKPDGVLVLGEEVYKQRRVAHPGHVCHPLAPTKAFFDLFLENFEKRFYEEEASPMTRGIPWPKGEHPPEEVVGVYAVATKKKGVCKVRKPVASGAVGVVEEAAQGGFVEPG